VNLSLIDRAAAHRQNRAIVTPDAAFTYGDLLDVAAQVARDLLNGSEDLQSQRVAFLIPAGFEYVAVQWGIWRSGGMAVPLCTVHPEPELRYVIEHSGATIVVAHPAFAARLQPIAASNQLRFILTTERWFTERWFTERWFTERWFTGRWFADNPALDVNLPSVDLDRRALILYTSGTTGKPKGVVTTHRQIAAQVTSLIEAWEWTESDRILHVLPLHHIHGIINVLTCALWAGAECHMLPKFEAAAVWEYLRRGDLTLFMAVPTIYAKLIAAWQAAEPEPQRLMSTGCANLRLMVSGSAALPVQILEQWEQISGHFLLERYGMTEIGMALSNPLHGPRVAGQVGGPLPQVQVRLVDEGTIVPAGTAGEIQVQGPGVFLEYWQNPEATAAAFDQGWFCTGDRAVVEDGNYRILGRNSIDIIKTGGYKVSALEIEELLRTHPAIAECAVVGLPDPEWGQRVGAAIVLRPDGDLTLETLRHWAKSQLATYKVPTRLAIVAALPRNAMGKVMKPIVIDRFGSD
jgi:malonyl-CoA/methylmalonyl-CoA synthetase